MPARLVARLRGLLTRRRVERELGKELAFHVEMETQANIERGLSPREARRQALLALGGVEQTREQVRDERAGPGEWLLQDLAHAARALRRSPGFAATVVAALAIGIGGTTLVFSVVEALVLRTLPYGDPDHLVVLGPFVPNWPSYERLRTDSQSFGQLAAYVERGANVTVNGESTRLGIAAVSRNYLDVAGIRPAAGRAFSDAGLAGQALLSDQFCRARFGTAPGAIGRTLTIDLVSYTIVGVMPPGFGTVAELAPNPEAAADLTVSLFVPVPLSDTWGNLRGSDTLGRLTAIGRLRRGATIAGASREVDVLFRGALPGASTPSGTFSVVPLSRAVAGDLGGQLTILSVAVGLLFLVACANVANLQLERLAGRRREFAVRTALGGGMARLVSAALAETALLGVAGGTAGILLAWGGVQAVRAGASPGLARLATQHLNGAVLMFSAAGTAVAALCTGVIPAWRISRSDAVRGMQPGSETTVLGRRGVVPHELVAWQVALAVILVFVGSLLVRDVARKITFDPGFKTERVLSAQVSPDRVRYSRRFTRNRESAHTVYCSTLLERASRLPGVRDAALTTTIPGAETYTGIRMQLEGRSFFVGGAVVSADYFSVLSIPIVAGRSLSRTDGVNTELVLVVNQAFARQHWASEREAVGRQVTFFGDYRPWTIVGVSRDARDEGLWRSVTPRAYVSFTQFPNEGPITILLRSRATDPAVLAKPLQDLARSLDVDQPVHGIMPLQAFLAAKLARERQIVAMMVVFALLTLGLATIGVHGLLSYAVRLRTREIAIRRALGGGAGVIVALVTRRSAWLVGLGIVIALPIAMALQWYLANVLGVVTDRAPLMMGGAVIAVVLSGLTASVASTRRAIQVEPTAVLRCE